MTRAHFVHVMYEAPSFFDTLVNLSLTANLQLCLDAGSASSYTSGQKFLDLSGNGIDFFRGDDATSEADDPTFNGNAGALTSSEYFSTDGGDKFKYDAANETFMNSVHKSSATISVIAWVYINTETAQAVCGTNAGNSSNIGFSLGPSGGGGTLNFTRTNGTGSSSTANGSINTTSWNMLGISLDEAGGAGGSFIYTNGTENTFDGAYALASASNATYTMELLSAGNSSQLMESGVRLGGLMFFDTNLTAANFDSIWSVTRNRFGV